MEGDLLPSQIEHLRRLTLSERFARGVRFQRMTRAWLAAGVKARHPDWTPAQIAVEVRRLIDHGDQ